MKKRIKVICKVDVNSATVMVVKLKSYLNKGYRIFSINKVGIGA